MRLHDTTLPPGLPALTAGQGAPLVVIGGFGPERSRPASLARRGLSSTMAPWAPHFTVTALSWRVRPEMPHPTMADIAADHAAAIRALSDAPVPVLGLSTGASISLQLAADHPDVLSRLVVLCGACRLGPEGRAGQRLVLERGRAGRRRAAWQALADLLADRRVARRAMGALLALTGGEFTPTMLALLAAEDGFDVEARLAGIRMPVLVVGGGRDRFYGPDTMARTAEGVPDGRLVLYPERGHVGAATDRRVVADALPFLRGGAATAG